MLTFNRLTFNRLTFDSICSAPALTRRQTTRGFSLLELLITMALMGLLLALAAPAFGNWTRNAQVRTVADSLQNGVRLAQAEAVRRNRQVVFFLTNDAACTTGINAAANGTFWSIRTVPLVSTEAAESVQCGVITDVAQGVTLAGPTAICFNSMGRQTANASNGLGAGAPCALAASGVSTYDVQRTGSDRPLRVLVALAGQLRLCDPARTLSATDLDGCPV
jgi:type IV fimbrial biogenesis protein FimT